MRLRSHVWTSAAKLSRDEKYLVSCGQHVSIRAGTIILWDVRDGATQTALRTIEGHKDRAMDVMFSPDGLRIASASMDGTVMIWSAQSGEGHEDKRASIV